MNKYPDRQFHLLSCGLFLLGLSTAVTPYMAGLNSLFGLLFLVGLLLAVILTGGNILCLRLWASDMSQCSPHIHSIHFFYAFGGFVAPLVAAPFLKQSTVDSQIAISSVTTVRYSRIDLLFPLIGLVTSVCSFGFFHYAMQEQTFPTISTADYKINQGNDGENKDKNSTTSTSTSLGQKILAGIFFCFLFLYVGVEYCYGTYLPAFAVEGNLHLSRAEVILTVNV